MNSGIPTEQAAAKVAFESILKAHFGPHTTAVNRPPYWELPQNAKDAYWRCFRANRAVEAASAGISTHTVGYHAATAVRRRFVNDAAGSM
jgi:hypothetical protein